MPAAFFSTKTSGMLKIEHASLRLGSRLLFRDFTLEAKSGELVCVTGESGCGKTSLLRAVLGFLPLEEGSVSIGGERLDVHTVDRLRRQVSYVPQELYIPEEWVRDMLRVPFDLKANRGTVFDEAALMAVWDVLGLERELLRRKVMQLSGGQRQRIVLSMSALLGKRLLIVDEPTSALDGESVVRVSALFRRMADEGTAVLAVSHNKEFMAACDRVVQLK